MDPLPSLPDAPPPLLLCSCQGKGQIIALDAEFVALEAEKASVLQVRAHSINTSPHHYHTQ